MGKGSSQPTQQNVKTETSNLPEYARPYFTNIMERAQAESYRPYTPYEGQRVADFTSGQQQTQQNIMGMQTPGQFGTASGLGTAAGLGSLMASQYDPNQFRAQQVRSQPLNYFQMQGPDVFGQQQADQYMSPYMQNVVDVQKREAIRDAQKGQLAQDLGAARQGTYGGSRQLLAGLERERNLGQQLGDIQYKGQQAAYDNAQQQFERDRAATQNAQARNLEAALGVQQLGSQTGLQAALANQQYGLEAQRLGEQSRQFGAQQGLAGLAQAGQMAQTLSNIGSAQQQADAQRLGMQQAVGAEQQAMEQRYLDTDYADFLRQRDYPMEQLGYFSNLMRGIPIGLSSTTTSYAPPPSMLSQVAGAGLGAAGLYNMYKGG
jgi:hypothetical protein